MELAAAVLEGWVVSRLGRRSVPVLAMVLGRLCDRFDVDPDVAGRVVSLAQEASRSDAELRPN